MSDVLFVEYPRCSTCRKAKAWLDDHKIGYSDRSIVEERPSAEELKCWHEQSGLPLRRIFNTSGKLYREQGIKDKLNEGIGHEEAYRLLATDGMLVKRPILVTKNHVFFGFTEDAWAEALL